MAAPTTTVIGALPAVAAAKLTPDTLLPLADADGVTTKVTVRQVLSDKGVAGFDTSAYETVADPTGYTDAKVAADASTGAKGVRLSPRTYNRNINITYGSATVPLHVPPGAMLKPQAGKAYTIAGDVSLTGLYQWIDLSDGGEVVFVIARARPEWFGAVADGVTDCYAGIMGAIAAVGARGIVEFSTGFYKCSDTILIDDGPYPNQKKVTLRGDSAASTFVYHVGAQATGCIRIASTAAAYGGGYIFQNCGGSCVEDMALGSISGPALSQWFTTKNAHKNITFFSAGVASSYLLIEGSGSCQYHNLIDGMSNDALPFAQLDAIAPRTTPARGFDFGDGDYTGTGVYGHCLEHFFFGCRIDGGQTAEAVRAIGHQDVRLLYFSGCKLTGPTNVGGGDAALALLDGAQDVYFMGGSYECVAGPLGQTQTAIRLDNQFGKTTAYISDVNEESGGMIDLGTLGGATGGFAMELHMARTFFNVLRDNYVGADTRVLNLIDTKWDLQPTQPGAIVFVDYANVLHSYQDDGVNIVPLSIGKSTNASVGGTIETLISASAVAGAGITHEIKRSRGTLAAPAQVANGDYLRQHVLWGFVGAAFTKFSTRIWSALDTDGLAYSEQAIDGSYPLSYVSKSASGPFVGTDYQLHVPNHTTHADNAAAVAAGLPAGRMYKTATGEVRVVV